MSRLVIHTLGMPRIEYAGNPLEFDRRKAVALLIYLALSEGVRGRDALANLLWPGYDQATARGNLRRTLSVLHTALHEDWLLIDRDMVSLRRDGDLWVDVRQFERLLGECRTHGHAGDQVCVHCLEPLTQAAALYRDDFLTGFTLADAPDFDDWQRDQTEHLRGVLSDALERLARCLVGRGDAAAALTQARRRVALDPLDEAAQRQLMQVHAWAGDRSAALRQYQICAELLRRELSTTPTPETTALFEAISKNRLPAPVLFALPSAQSLLTTERSKQVSSPPKNEAGAQGELRLVTILCVGLAGEAEPEIAMTGLDRLLFSLETILGRYEARLDRLLGDSVIAVFGAGQVHEDDAERAVQAAQALVEEARGQAGTRFAIQVSVGVATDEAYFGPVGRGGQATHSVLGPLVNRAARLQGRAAAGQVLADQATYRRTHQAFAYRALDSAGTPASAQAYEVAGVLARPAKTRGIEGLRAELIGRDEELAKLGEMLARVQAGQGQVVSLVGEAGLGKSRLVAELKAISTQPSALSSQHSGVAWLEGRGLEMATSTSYGPFVDLLRGHFTATDAVHSEPPALAAAIRSDLYALRDASLLAADQVEELGPLLGNLLSVTFGDDWDERLRMADPAQIRYRTFAALRTFFAALAGRQPIVLVLEDLHWADSLSLDLIGELLGLLAGHPLLLLCVYRPGREYPSERLAAMAERRHPGRYIELRLHPLRAEEIRQMLASLLMGEALPTRVRELIVAQGEGNPFFTEEVVRGLIDAGLFLREGAHWRVQDKIELIRVPEGVQGVILSRVDRLAGDDRQALQAAAVLGRLFRPRVLARLVAPDTDVAAALDRLAERDFVYLERTWPEAEYSFKHVLTQQAVYGTLLAARKAHLHRQAGEAIEALYGDNLAEHYEALAHHYDHGDGGEKAVEYLLKAGEKARRAYLNDEAIAYFERVLARSEQVAPAAGRGGANDAAWLEALTGLGKVHFLVGRFVEAEGWLRKAIDLAKQLRLPLARLARYYFWLGDALHWQYRYAEVVALGEEGLELLGDDRESTEAALMSALVSINSFVLGDYTKGRVYAFRIARFIEQLPYEEELRSAYTAVSIYTEVEKHIEESRRWLRILETHGKRHHDLRAVAWSRGHQGIIMQHTGDCYGAILALRDALQLSRQIGDVSTGVAMLCFLWGPLLSLGDLDEAEHWCRSGVEGWLTPEQVVAATAGEALAFASAIMLCKGDCAGALQASRERSENYPVIPPSFGPEVMEWQARVHRAVGHRAEAFRNYQETLTQTMPEDMRFRVSWHISRPRFSLILSGLEEACADAAAFRAICQRYRDEHAFDASASVLQWYLEPSDVGTTRESPRWALDFHRETVEQSESSGWIWHDPFGDCSSEQHAIDGLVIRAANGRDLYFLNRSAPRWLRPVDGDFVAETVCAPALADRPASGGLVLWKDEDKYLSLNWGRGGPHEICLEGCVNREDRVFGRGRLPAERTFLRLARRGERVDALCSADGATWWSVGHAAFPAADPVQVGVCASGMIDRTIYPGAYREGTAIRFESFRLW